MELRSPEGDKLLLNHQKQFELNRLFPEKTITLLSDKGSSAVVFVDESDRAYKVYRDNENYGYSKDEAAILTMLQNEAIVPHIYQFLQPHILPPNNSEVERKFPEYDNLVPSETADTETAVLVMEKIDFEKDGKDKINDDELWNAFKYIREVAMKYRLVLGDIEIVFNKQTHQATILDVAGIGKFTIDVANSRGHYRYKETNITDEEVYEMDLNQDLLMLLARGNGKYNIPDEEMLRVIRQKDDEFFRKRLINRSIEQDEETQSNQEMSHTPLPIRLIERLLEKLARK